MYVGQMGDAYTLCKLQTFKSNGDGIYRYIVMV